MLPSAGGVLGAWMGRRKETSDLSEGEEDVKRPRITKQVNYNRCGYIECIELIDFMCHRHLCIKPSPGVNFIVGNNGSGKSALLSALSVTLGSRASATQRANRLEGLVREGASEARIRLTLNNSEAYPFKPNVYGDRITIERRIGNITGRYYACYSAHGRLQAEGKEEVLAIVDHFGLQVDNPLAVLTQETAKRFLASARPRELHDFFMRATLIESLMHELSFAGKQRDEATLRNQALKQNLTIVDGRVAELREQFRALSQMQTAAIRLQSLRREMAWSLVRSEEIKLAERQEEANAWREKGDRIEELLDADEETIDNLSAQIVKGEGGLLSLRDRSRDPSERHREIGERLASEQKSQKNLAQDFKSLQMQIQRKQAQIQDLIDKLSDSNLDQAAKKRTEQLNQKIERKKAEIKDAQVQLAKLTSRQTELELQDDSVQRIRELRTAFDEASAQNEQAQARLGQLKSQLATLRAAQTDRLRAFGDRLPQLMRSLQSQQKMFHRAPVGPIGMQVRLKGQDFNRWLLPMEVLIGKFLGAFIVHDHHDRQALEQILRQHNMQRTEILVMNHDRAVRDGYPRLQQHVAQMRQQIGNQLEGAHLAMDLLEAESPLVLYALCTMASIERTLFVEGRNDAMRLMPRTRTVGINTIFTPTHRMIALPGGNISYTVLFADAWTPKCLTDSPQATRMCEEDLERVERDAKAHLERAKSLDADRRQIERNQQLRQVEQERLSKEQRACSEKLRKLTEELSAISEHDQAGDGGLAVEHASLLSFLTGQRLEAEGEEARLQAQLGAVEGRLEASRQLVEGLAAQRLSIETEMEGMKQEMADLQSSLKELLAQRKEVQQRHASRREEHALLLGRIQVAMRDINAMTSSISNQIAQIKETFVEIKAETPVSRDEMLLLGEENETDGRHVTFTGEEGRPSQFRPAEQIQSDLRALERTMAELQRSRLRPEQVRADLQAALRKQSSMRRAVQINDAFLLKLGTGLAAREAALVDFRDCIALLSNTEFMHQLNNRGFIGRLHYDFAKHELNLIVTPPGQDSNEKGDAEEEEEVGNDANEGEEEYLMKEEKSSKKKQGARSVRQLSGGEKSFSTACFLMSLWPSLAAPIRCLDEFDVFMDSVNRKYVLEMLMSSARKDRVQFFLITPNAVTNVVEIGEHVKVFRLNDPERGNLTQQQ